MKLKILLALFSIILFVGSSMINPSVALNTSWWDSNANNQGSGNVLTNSLNKAQVNVFYKFWVYNDGKHVINNEPALVWIITFYSQVNPLENNGSSTNLNSANITFQHPNNYLLDNFGPSSRIGSNNEELHYQQSIYPDYYEVKYSVPNVEILPYANHGAPSSITWILNFKSSAQKQQTGIYFQMYLIDWDVSSNNTYIDNCSISLKSSAGSFNTIIVPFYISLNAPNSTPSIYTESVSNSPSSQLVPYMVLGMSVIAISFIFLLYINKRKWQK